MSSSARHTPTWATTALGLRHATNKIAAYFMDDDPTVTGWDTECRAKHASERGRAQFGEIALARMRCVCVEVVSCISV
jgi:hypothetical protein